MTLRELKNIRALDLTACSLLPVVALCDDAPPPPPPQGVWTGKGQAGYGSSQGNSAGNSANAALETSLLDSSWKHSLHLGGLYGESAGIVSAERREVQWQTDYALSVGYSIQNNSKPPEGLRKLDSIETVNLVYAF